MRQSGPEYAGALSLLALGVILGPSGLGVLTPQLLALVDPAIPVGLTALGVLAALDFDAYSRDAQPGRPVVRTLRDVAVAVAVAGAVAALGLALSVDGDRLWAVAGMAGTCALATRSRHAEIPILLVALALAWTGSGAGTGSGGSHAAWNVGNTVMVSAGCALIGWLMLRRQASVAEQRGAAVAILLLIGGAADYLSVSALLAGLAAGTCWRLMGGTIRESVRREVTYLRHPVVAILLLTAGARIELTAVTIGLGIGYATISVALSELIKTLAPATLAPVTAAGGSNILAIALALSAFRLLGPEMALPLTAIVVGTMLLQALAMSRGRTEAFE